MKSFLSVRRPDVSWSELSAPKAIAGALRRISAEARRRAKGSAGKRKGDEQSGSRGFAVLFSGPSGSGKSRAAEVLASDLGRELYRVDSRAAVGNQIGETEKNLGELFDAADAAAVVLFFDEADALFGKRDGVKDANDRFASAQTNYLLQRLEKYDGLAILATSVVGNLDHPAFIRRFARVIDFGAGGRSG